MRRKVAARSSRDVEPDKQLPRYGLRKRTAQSDGKNLEDVLKYQTLAKRTKPTTTLTRAQSSSWRESVKKRTRIPSGQGCAQKNKNKSWLAEAILEENDTQYLIEYEPVYEGAQPEISWQPKRNANAALVAWWEERKMASALENSHAERDEVLALMSKDNGVSQRRDLVGYGSQPRKLVTNIWSLKQYGTESEDLQQDSGDLVETRTSGGFEETPRNTPLKANSTIVPGILDTPVPERDVPVAHMFESVALNSRGGASARPCDDMATEVESGRSQPKPPKVASSTSQHLEPLASSQQIPTTDGENSGYLLETKELQCSLVEAANACVLENRKDHTSANAAYGVLINNHSRVEGLEQVSESHVTKRDGQGKPSPRPGTSISTILSPAPSTVSNNSKDNGSTTPAGKDSGQASPRTLAHVKVSNNRDLGVSGAVSGKLASAREQLRLLLRGPGRRRFRKSSLRFPPSP